MVTCREFELAISAYVDRETPVSDHVNMFGHLAACADCREFMQVVIAVKCKVAREGGFRSPEGLSGQLPDTPATNAFQHGIRRSMRRVVRHRVSIPVPLLACAAFLLVIGTFFLSQKQDGPQPIPASNVILSGHGMSLKVIRVHQE